MRREALVAEHAGRTRGERAGSLRNGVTETIGNLTDEGRATVRTLSAARSAASEATEPSEGFFP
jgi:hypothetical protein